MQSPTSNWQAALRHNPALLIIAVLRVLLHCLTNTTFFGFGYFRDEFYYLTSAQRLALGYVDNPPLSIWLLAASRWLFGESLLGLRLIPAVCAGGLVLLTGLLAWRLGGGRLAQAMAGLAAAVTPIYAIISSFYSMNALELLFWTFTVYLLVVLIQDEQPKLWLAIGATVGLGLLNKHTMITFVLALGIGVVLSPARRFLLTRWFWLGGALAVLILAPNLWWQAQQAFPSLEFYRNAEIVKNVPTPPADVLLNQWLVMGPVAAALWLPGLLYLLFARNMRALRGLGIAFLLTLGLLVLARSSRPDRMGGAYPILLAAGTVFWQQVVRQRFSLGAGRRLAWAGLALLGVGGLAFLPISQPILPPAATAEFATAVGAAQEMEQGKQFALPQYMADRLDWQELVATVGAVYQSLSADEQSNLTIFTDNYGQAGAIDFFGDEYELPLATSGHNNYFLWGAGARQPTVLLAIGHRFEDPNLQAEFDGIEQVATFRCEFCVEDGTPIYLLRGLKRPWAELWPQFKHYE